MKYLKQFARKRNREETEVLTARLPKSLYKDFKRYCDELGLSISEAVFLLVEREMKEAPPQQEPPKETNGNLKHLHKNNDNRIDDVVTTNTIEYKPKTPKRQGTTTRFTTKKWVIEGELPCPICRQWVSASNFSRHAKQHNTITKDIFTDESYLEIVDEMIQDRQSTKA